MNTEKKFYRSANTFFKEKFGTKIIKIALDGGFTCPNRDGTLSYGGCIFCSEKGSGDFAGDRLKPIDRQFEDMKKIMQKKWKNGKYMAYFQSFTNTYAPLPYLKELFFKASKLQDVVAISIATRPDCISEELVKFLAELKRDVYVCIELGFQTSKKESVKLINRCYENKVFEECMRLLNKYEIDAIAHVILGLPYETKEDMLNTVSYVSSFGISGIKLQLLHVLKNTALADLYEKKPFKILTMEEYIDIVISCIEILPEEIVIHRITGDGDRKNLIEPKWSLNKKVILNTINKEFYNKNTYHGRLCKNNVNNLYRHY